MAYNPSADCGDEQHNLADLYHTATAHRLAMNDRTKYPHMLPLEDGHYGSLMGGYKPHLQQGKVDHTIKKAKELKRPHWKPEHWTAWNMSEIFYQNRDKWIAEFNQIDQDHINGTTDPETGIRCIDRFHIKDVSYEWFVKNYERPAIPCMIAGLTDEWEMNRWTMKNMVEEHLGDELVKIGKDKNGRRLEVPFDQYAHYLATTKDDSALYLFESQMDRTERYRKVFDAYQLPKWFEKDLLNFCHPDRRPPHRWFCVANAGSGTTMHADPLGLLAWNSVLAGRKMWIVFDPITPEHVACGEDFMSKPPLFPNVENEAIGWFVNVWPKLKQWLQDNKLCGKYNPRILIQYPGETIFMPGGVWHYVLNLDDSLAVTQNYCNMSNFDLVWREFRRERRHAALRWLSQLKRRFPIAYQRALIVNKMDGVAGPKIKKPHLKSAHQIKIEQIKLRLEVTPDVVTDAEKQLVVEWDNNHSEDRVWELEEAPFAYSPLWERWSGSEDSSTDSSEEEESSSSSDEESEDEKQ
eukprot:UN04454